MIPGVKLLFLNYLFLFCPLTREYTLRKDQNGIKILWIFYL